MNDKNLALMDSVMDVITQSDEWRDIQKNDPRITASYERWDSVLERVKPILPWKLYAELSDAHDSDLAVISDAGILFGIHVAEAIRDVASRPADLSRHILERMKGEAEDYTGKEAAR